MTKRGEVWYFRTRVPTHLVRAFGRAMVSLSLETNDRTTAELLARRRREELDRAFEALEVSGPRSDAEYAGSVLHLSDDDIDRLCDRFSTQMLVSDELQRGLSPF